MNASIRVQSEDRYKQLVLKLWHTISTELDALENQKPPSVGPATQIQQYAQELIKEAVVYQTLRDHNIE